MSIEMEKILGHLGYLTGGHEDDSGLVGRRYRATRREDPDIHVAIDVVDLKAEASLSRLCENLERTATLSDCPYLVNLRDAVSIQDNLFLAVWDLPRSAAPLEKLAAPEDFWPAAARLVSAVRFLHRRELVHAAISPYTIYSSPEGPLLGEFWWMHNAEQLPLAPCPSEDVSAFTPAKVLPFLSPEELRGEPPTRDSDLYALGAIFYYLLTGKPPRAIPQDSTGDYRQDLSVMPLVPLDEALPDLPEDILAVVERLLVDDPASRLNIFMLESLALERTGQLPEDALS